MASKETFEGLGVLLFLVGAGIGALLVLATVSLLKICQKRRKTNADAVCAAAADSEAAADAGVHSKLPKDVNEKLSIDEPIKGVYEVEVRHAQISEHHQGDVTAATHSFAVAHALLTGPFVPDSSLLNKVGHGFKSKYDSASGWKERGPV